ncbi:MAG: MBL fold metallo-hydrolase [Candidatus Helarchaeota archaeon]
MLKELIDGVYFIEGQKQGKYPYANSLLILGKDKNCIIDTGIGSKLMRKLKRKFKIDIVLLSHNHEDHTCGLKYLKESKIYIHELDRKGVESIRYLQGIYGLDDPKYNALFDSFMISIGYKECKINEVLRDGQIFDLGNIKIEVIHTPGHSAGHCCFLIHPNLMFLADIDLTSFGPWYGSRDGNISDFIASIKKIMNYKIEIAISSHKGIFYNNITDKLQQYLNKFYEREQIILENLKQRQTLEELAKNLLIYGNIPEPEEMFFIAEKLMIEKHLERLIRNKKIKKENGFYFI